MDQNIFATKVARNTLYQLLGKGMSTVLGLVAVAMMTRYLGREGFGGYATIIAFLQFFGIVIDFGLTLITIQMISEPGADEQKIMSNIFTLRLLSAIVFLSLAPVAVLLFPYPENVKLGVLITTFSFLFISLHQVLVGIFQKNLRMDKIALAENVGRVALVVGVFAAVYFNAGILGIMSAVVLGSFINWLVTFIFSRRYVKIVWDFDFSLWKKIIKRSWPIGISIVFNLIYLKADTIFLSLVRSQEEVGLYGAAYRVVDILTMIPIMVVGVVLPFFTKYWAEKNKEQFKYVLDTSLKILFFLAFPIVVGALILAGPVMVLVAGEDFALSGNILQVLIFGVAAIFFGSLFGHIVVSLNKQRQMIWGYLATAALSLAGYLIFIPRYSYYGAAGVTVFSETLIAIITFAMVYYTTRISPSWKVALKPLLASVVMGIFLYVIKDLPVLLSVFLGGAIYFITLYFLKGFDKNFVKEILRFRQKKV